MKNKIETILKLIGFDEADITKIADENTTEADFQSSLEAAEKKWRTEYNESIETSDSLKKKIRAEMKDEVEKGYIAQRLKEYKVEIAKRLNLPGTMTEIKEMSQENFVNLLAENATKFTEAEKAKYEQAIKTANDELETITGKFEALEKEIPTKYIDRTKYEDKIKDKKWADSVAALETGSLSKEDAVLVLQGRLTKKGWTPYVKDDESIGFRDKDGNVVKNDKMKEVALTDFVSSEAETLKPVNAGTPPGPKGPGGEQTYISKAAQAMS